MAVEANQVSKKIFWMCPHCGTILEKKEGSGEMLAMFKSVSGSASCAGCGLGQPLTRVYRGEFDFRASDAEIRAMAESPEGLGFDEARTRWSYRGQLLLLERDQAAAPRRSESRGSAGKLAQGSSAAGEAQPPGPVWTKGALATLAILFAAIAVIATASARPTGETWVSIVNHDGYYLVDELNGGVALVDPERLDLGWIEELRLRTDGTLQPADLQRLTRQLNHDANAMAILDAGLWADAQGRRSRRHHFLFAFAVGLIALGLLIAAWRKP